MEDKFKNLPLRNGVGIIVLNEGEVLEEGTHEELLEHEGLYSKLYKLNYASFDDALT